MDPQFNSESRIHTVQYMDSYYIKYIRSWVKRLKFWFKLGQFLRDSHIYTVLCTYIRPVYPYRPIAGSVNLCPDAIQGSDIEKVIATVKHELLHAMVCAIICL